MADKKITELTALAESPASGDYFILVDVSDATMAASGTDKKITKANLLLDSLKNIVEDATPQLGGNLDVNGKQIVTVSNGHILLMPNGTGKVGIGGTPNQKLTIEGTMSLKEQASANADVAAYGQLWVKTATPNQLWFTNDAGTDTQLGTGGGGGSNNGITKTIAASDSVDGANTDYTCNGTDDEITLNSAITAVNNAGGGTVEMLEGIFLVSDNVIVKSNVKLLGQGVGSIIKLKDSADALTNAGIVRFKVSGGTNNSILESFAIDGNKANQANGTNKMGVYHEGKYCTIKNLYVHDCPTYGIDPHEQNDTSFTEYLLITGNHVKNCGDASLGDHDGITLDKCRYSIVSNNLVEGSSMHGISLVTGTTHVTVIGNISKGNGDNGLNLNGSTTKIEHCVMSDNITSANTLSGIQLSVADYCVVTGNTSDLNQQRGIRINKSSYNVISSNSCIDNSQQGNDSYDEIYLSDADSVYSTHNTITNNIIRCTQTNKARYGIRENHASSDYNHIAGNIINGAVTGNISILGVNTTTGETQSLAAVHFNDSTERTAAAWCKSGSTTFNSNEGIPMLRAGSLLGVCARFEIKNYATEGELQVDVYVNNVVKFSAKVNINANGFYTLSDTQAQGIDTFSAGDYIGVKTNFLGSSAYGVDDIMGYVEIGLR